MKNLFFVACFLLPLFGYAQKFTAETGQVSFFSNASVEDIEAVNTFVGSLFNNANGDLVYIVKIRDFAFNKALMREHFNEKYMESDKFPKATFQGKVLGYKPNVSGEQKVNTVGKLTIHGAVREINVPGIMGFVNGKILIKSKFIVKLADYNIRIPKLIWQNIAEEIEMKINFIYKPM